MLVLVLSGIVWGAESNNLQEKAIAGPIGGGPAAPHATGNVIYDSIPMPYPGSFPSLGYEATSTDEFGDHIAFAGTDRELDSVVVSLTNWACENDFDFDLTSSR